LFSVASRAPAFLGCSTRRVASGDVVRVHRLLRDRRDFEPCCPVLRRYFDEARLVATTIEAGRAKIKEDKDRSVGVTQGDVRAR
jgi:hypothetical protein